ncbi:hypothetical protein OUZ56_031715 [Daphnia magna]|uniref:Uncharacterized protein n=1 Tax=Daphnia magna TaxID=35525 RepID=A0ABQ9ZW15_9CRUS|nr:hypothetical protein OUZ56_031715 [Daphnia magna]
MPYGDGRVYSIRSVRSRPRAATPAVEFGLDEEKEGGMRHLADHVFVLSAKMKTDCLPVALPKTDPDIGA